MDLQSSQGINFTSLQPCTTENPPSTPLPACVHMCATNIDKSPILNMRVRPFPGYSTAFPPDKHYVRALAVPQ